jgi:FkbM family methyltransferase
LDVGANIGNHAIFLSTFIADHLIAIEPNAAVLPTLRRNLSKNVSNYTLYECAVGAKQGRGKMIVPDNMSDNLGAAQVDMESNNSDIEITTLDTLFSTWIKNETTSVCVSLIKIDVEGMEPLVLKGAIDIITEYKPHIIVEAPTKQELKKINEILIPLGYKKLPGRWALTPVYHFAYKPSVTLFAQACYMKVIRSLSRSKQRINKRLAR